MPLTMFQDKLYSINATPISLSSFPGCHGATAILPIFCIHSAVCHPPQVCSKVIQLHGSLLFSLVIHPVIIGIENACESLFFNKWYLDDGALQCRIKQVEAYRQSDFWGPQSPALLHNSVHAEYIMHHQAMQRQI